MINDESKNLIDFGPLLFILQKKSFEIIIVKVLKHWVKMCDRTRNVLEGYAGKSRKKNVRY